MNANRTLTRYYLYSALNGLQFGWTTWLAYVLLQGGNPGWAESAFHLAILLGEVPTGIVADLLGRRRSMMIGLAVGATASFSYPLITDTVTACLVLGLSGFGSTFLSGADTALLYETAKQAGGSDLARKAMARASAIQLAALSAAPVIAGLLYEQHTLAPFISRGLISLSCILIVFGMTEVRAESHKPRVSIWGHTREAVQAVLTSPAILMLMLFSWAYNAVGAMVGQFGQAYFPATGLTMAGAGIVFALARLASAGGSELSERLSGASALRWLRFGPLAQSLAYLGMGLTGSWKGGGWYVAGEALDGLIYPTLQHQFNERIPSEQRATILSLQSAGFSMLMVVAFPAASYLQPVSKIYLATGGVGVLVALAWILSRFWTQPAQAAEGVVTPCTQSES